MNRKLNAVGLVLLAALVASALSVMGAASAETGGHFTSDAKNEVTNIRGWETGQNPHTTRFFVMGQKIKCYDVLYTGKETKATVTEVKVTPIWDNCEVEDDQSNVAVTHNECKLVLTVRAVKPEEEESTVALECPAGQKVELQNESKCTLTVGPQTIQQGGVVYFTTKHNDKHTLTVRVVAEKIAYERHGLCGIFGTSANDGKFSGSVFAEGYDTDNKTVNITATGK